MTERPSWMPSREVLTGYLVALIPPSITTLDEQLDFLGEEFVRAVAKARGEDAKKWLIDALKLISHYEEETKIAVEKALAERDEEWATASGLETSQGDPEGITPARLGRFMAKQEADRHFAAALDESQEPRS